MLLASEMDAEFLHPARESEFARVRGRTRGCSFELRVIAQDKRQPEELVLTMRHWSNEHVVRLAGPGCEVPALDPVHLRAAIEQACDGFSTGR
jgi:hypothetical protein